MTKAATLQKTVAHLPLAASGNPAFSDEPLDGQQLSSLYAVIAYVAHGIFLKPDLLQARVEMEFGITHVSSLRRRDFTRAIEFLLDLHMSEVRSRK